MRDNAVRACCPCIEDLVFEPELATLALVDASLAIAVQALIARNPELLLGDTLPRPAPRTNAARTIVVLYREMHDALEAYRALLPSEHELARGNDDFPF